MTTEKIDVHAHYFPPAYGEMLDRHGMTILDGGFPRPEWNEEIQLAGMEQLGTSCSALSISSPHLHMGDAAEAAEAARASNEYGAGLVKKYPQQFMVLASLPLPEIEASVQEAVYCREVLGVDGFALLTNSRGVYLGDPRLDPVMEELNRGESVVLLHPTQPAAVPEGVAEELPYPLMEFFFDTTRTVVNMLLHRIPVRYPKIRSLIPHAGAFLPVLSDRLISLADMFFPEGDVDIAESLAAFYYDLAGMSMPKQYGNLRQMVPEDHLLYGSDTPFTPMPLCVQLAEEMDRTLDAEMAQRVYRENPRKLMKPVE